MRCPRATPAVGSGTQSGWHPGVKLVKREVRGREVRKESKVKAFQKELDKMV